MSIKPYLDSNGIRLYNADSRRIPDVLEPDQADAIVTDPPYELAFSAGERSRQWDSTGIAFDPDYWRSIRTVVKPGGFLLAFGASRTWHRLACAIEDAGWIIRDQIMWVYASGMPKGEWADRAVDRTLGQADPRNPRPGKNGVFSRCREREGAYEPQTPQAAAWSGWNPSLKPAWEPIIVAQKPRILPLGRNLLEYGTGALNVGALAIEADMDELADNYRMNDRGSRGPRGGTAYKPTSTPRPQGPRLDGRYPSDLITDPIVDGMLDGPRFYQIAKADGTERPMLRERMLARGTADWHQACDPLGINPDASEYPASLFDRIPDGADDLGERLLAHPTVKPLELMRLLVRLTVPDGGLILEPFAGSGTTLQACLGEHRRCIGFERDPAYLPLIRQRLDKPLQSSLF